jgi:predicted Zn-dependent peptidase
VIHRETLDNGLTVLAESMPDVRSVSIGVWLRQGSRSEPSGLNGISHFIEHLVFKGTESRSAREIALTMDSVGGQVDAFTSKEYTCFYAKVLDEHVDTAVELLGDVVQRPLFDPTELERERQVVLEEIRMVEDTPDELIYDLFAGAFYPGTSLGRPIQGTARSVSALTRPQLLRFFRRAYRPENLVIAAAGHLRHGRFLREIRRVFGRLERGGPSDGRGRPPRPRATSVRRSRRELEQLHVMLGVPSHAEGSPQRYALHVLNTILGGTMSSRLFQKVREERGLAYTVYSGLNAFVDAGFLAIYAATSPRTAHELVRLVLEELRALRDRGATAEELSMAKEHLKGSLMLALESTSSRMSNLARQEIYLGRQLGLEATLRRIDAVRRREVHELARELFGRRRTSFAAVGRVDRLRLSAGALVL